MMTIIEAATLIVNKKLNLWEKAKRDLDSQVTWAVKHKENLTDNYWQEEHTARLQYQTALHILEALMEAS